MKKQKCFKRVTAATIALGLIFTPANMAVFAEEDNMLGIYKGDGFELSYSIRDNWGNSYIIDASLKNTTDTTIEDWCLIYLSTDKINDIWNAASEQNENITVISNSVYNQDIAAGETINYSFCVETDEPDFPDKFELISEPALLDESAYNISIDVINDWGEGYNAGLTITNNSDSIIEDWYINFDWEEDIDYLWNAQYSDFGESHKRLNNAEYNQNIAPGDSVTIGIQNLIHGFNNNNLSNIQLFEYGNSRRNVIAELTAAPSVTIDTTDLSFNEDENYYNIYDKCDSIKGSVKPGLLAETATYKIENMWGKVLCEGSFVPGRKWTIDGIGFVLGLNKITIDVLYNDGSTSQTSEWYMNYCEDNMTNITIDADDSDNDGLIAYVEEIYGTNPNLYDTDGDGLSDYQELIDTGTNPLEIDSDNDGIIDSAVDYDNDGITTIEEYNLGTSPFCIDTDGDSLTDDEEINTYKTDPNKFDTDDDGADDKWELDNGYNPLVYNNSFISEITEELGDISVSAKVTSGNGNISSFNVKPAEENTFINPSTPGYIGTAVELTMDGSFDSAELSFDFNNSYLEDKDFVPAIYYFNENSNSFEEIPTLWDGESNKVSAVLNHFSTYILLNKTAFEEVMNKVFSDNSINAVPKNIVFLLDRSGSMSTNDPNDLRKDATNEFISSMNPNDKAQILSFEDNVHNHTTTFTSDVKILKEKLDLAISASGGTRIGNAITEAINLFSNISPDDYDNYIIVFTDGESSDSLPSDYITKCNSKKITVITIGLGNYIDPTYLKNMCTDPKKRNITNYLHANTEEDIKNTYEDAFEIIYGADSNSDKILDTDTIALFKGELLVEGQNLFDKVKITKLSELDKDIDGDGLLNGEELIITHEKNGKVKVTMISDPTIEDTDGDSYSDGYEKNHGMDPLKYDISVNDLTTLTNSDIYMSSTMSNGYKESTLKNVQLFLGNAIFNFKLSRVSNYEKTLVLFLDEYAKQRVETANTYNMATTFQAVLSKLKSDLVPINNYFYIHSTLPLQDVTKTYAFLDLEDKIKKIDVLQDALSHASSIDDYYMLSNQIKDLTTKINTTVNNIDGLVATQPVKFGAWLDKHYTGLKNTKFINSLEIKIKPNSKIYSSLKNSGNVLTAFGYLTVATETASNCIDDYMAMNSLLENSYAYEEYSDLLFSLRFNSDDDAMQNAASNIMTAIDKSMPDFTACTSDVLTGIAKEIKTYAANSNPYVLIIDLGLTASDMVFNTSGTNDGAVSTIALGEAATCYSNELIYRITNNWAENHAYKDTDNYYFVSDNKRINLYMLAELRKSGEMKFNHTVDSYSPLYTKIYNLITGENIKTLTDDFCNDRINTINSIISNRNIYN